MLASSSATVSAKSPEAFRTISEVSSELDVPQHVLRFWEGRFAQIKPVKRAGGRRYYRPEDVDLLRGIRALLYLEGFTIKGAQKILRDRGLRYVAELGRGETGFERPSPRKLSEFIAVPKEPEFARAAFSVLERAPDAGTADAPADSDVTGQEHEKLSGLLHELLEFKRRLHAVRSSTRS
jgi:DNA-binding transcriptional MerR regulator